MYHSVSYDITILFYRSMFSKQTEKTIQLGKTQTAGYVPFYLHTIKFLAVLNKNTWQFFPLTWEISATYNMHVFK